MSSNSSAKQHPTPTNNILQKSELYFSCNKLLLAACLFQVVKVTTQIRTANENELSDPRQKETRVQIGKVPCKSDPHDCVSRKITTNWPIICRQLANRADKRSVGNRNRLHAQPFFDDVAFLFSALSFSVISRKACRYYTVTLGKADDEFARLDNLQVLRWAPGGNVGEPDI